MQLEDLSRSRLAGTTPLPWALLRGHYRKLLLTSYNTFVTPVPGDTPTPVSFGLMHMRISIHMRLLILVRNH